MFFWTKKNETPLSEAVIDNDLDAVRALGRHKAHRFATNYLGFNAMEIARYLDRRDCLKILDPHHSPRQMRVVPKDETEIQVFDKKAFEEFFHLRFLTHLIFEDYNTFCQVVKSCPRSAWENLEYREGYFADVTIQWIDEFLEYGVFSNQEIKKGDVVGEYVGVVHRAYRFYPHRNPYCLKYPFTAGPLFAYQVDCKDQGNETRFINHSYEPNLDPKTVIDRGIVHTIFVATQDISKGTQLTWDYGEDYWRYRDPPVEI